MLHTEIAGSARPQPTPDKSPIDQLAEDMIDLTAAEGCATRDRLLERGWGEIELLSYETEARKRARAMLVRTETRPVYNRAARITTGARELGHIMPTIQQAVMHLQNRRFSKPELDDILPDIAARAALAFSIPFSGDDVLVRLLRDCRDTFAMIDGASDHAFQLLARLDAVLGETA